jgi:hypothetical protein
MLSNVPLYCCGSEVEIALQKAHEAFPAATPRVISDHGSQFIPKEFKQLEFMHN